MTIVTAHPVPFNLVLFGHFKQSLPEVAVGHRLLLGVLPAALYPAVDPLSHALFDILRISRDSDPAWPRQGLKPGNRTAQFHAVIGRLCIVTREFFLMPAKTQNRAPASRPRVTGAGAVGEDFDLGAFCFIHAVAL